MWSSLRLIFPLTGKSGGQSLPTGWARPAPDGDGDPIGIAAAIGAAVPDPALPGDGSANADDEAGDGSNEGAGVSINATACGEAGGGEAAEVGVAPELTSLLLPTPAQTVRITTSTSTQPSTSLLPAPRVPFPAGRPSRDDALRESRCLPFPTIRL